MSCISIRLKKTPTTIPTYLLSEDGYAYLDLPQDADITYFKNLNQLTDINDIPFDYVVSVPLVATTKNNKILEKYLQGDNSYTEVMIYNGHFWVSYLMSVQEINYEEIECEFVSYALYWARQLDAKKINTLDLGVIREYDWGRGYNLPAIPNNTPIPVPYNPLSPNSSVAAYPLCDWGDLRYMTDNFFPVGGAAMPINEEGEEGDTICIIQPKPLIGDDEHDNSWNTPTAAGRFSVAEYPRKPTIGPSDFRPFVFINKMVKQIFAEEGYAIYSPILDSPHGRSVIAYLLDPNLSEESLEPTRNIRLFPNGANPSDVTFRETTRSFTSLRFWPQIGGVYDVDAKANVHFRPNSGKDSIVVTKLVVKEQGMIVDIIDVVETARPEKDRDVGYGNIVVNIKKSGVIVKENQYLELVHYFLGNITVMIIPATSDDWVGADDNNCIGTDSSEAVYTEMTVTQKNRFFWRDFRNSIVVGEREIALASILDRNISRLDFFKAIVHLFNLKLYTDFTNKVVYMMQPDDINWYGEDVEGFFLADHKIDVIPTTYKVRPTEKVKEIKLQFKGSDHYHNVVPISDEGDTIELENPLFEPTLFQVYGKGSSVVTGEGAIYRSPREYLGFDVFPNMVGELDEISINERNLILMNFSPIVENQSGLSEAIWRENQRYKVDVAERPEILFDVSPRILMYYGARRQPHNNRYYIRSVRFSNENVLSAVINTAGHYHPAMSAINPTNEGDMAANQFSRATQTLYFILDKAFSDETGYSYMDADQATNLTYLYYNWLKCYYLNPTIRYLIDTKPNEFFKHSMRELMTINHLGLPKSTIIENIDNFSSCKTIPTEYSFKPYAKNMYPICESYKSFEVRPRAAYRCLIENNPQLSVKLVGDDIELSIVGLNTDPITQTTFELSLDGVDWTELNNFNALTSYVPNTGDVVLLRGNVNYITCGDIPTSIVEFNPCGYSEIENIIQTTTTKLNGQTCTKADIVTDVTHTVELFEVEVDGVTTPYVAGTEICDFIQATFIISIKVGECIYVQVEEVNGELDVTCPDVEDISIDYNPITGMLSREGTLNIEPLEDIIYYSIENAPNEWSEFYYWDNRNPVFAQKIRARRVIRFCGECEDICTPIYLWEDFVEYTLGCNDCTLFVEQGVSGCTVAWDGPNGFTGTGTPIEVEDTGQYTATITCMGVPYTATIDFVKPNSGTPTDNPIILTF
jgi:hypothetical protein